MTRYQDHKSFGDYGEEWTREILNSLGMVVERANRPGADWESGQVSIEVKIAARSILHPNRQMGYQFCLRRDGHTELDADFLVCLICPDGCKVIDSYVIPRNRVGHKRKLVIPTDDYKGKWREFLDAWNLITAHPGIDWR